MWEEGQKVNTHTHTHTYTHTKRGEGGKEKEGSLLSRRRRQQSGGGGGGSGSGGSSTWQRRARPLPQCRLRVRPSTEDTDLSEHQALKSHTARPAPPNWGTSLRPHLSSLASHPGQAKLSALSSRQAIAL
ncbi:uncharacterized protein LOC106027021 isoform X5 [Cavia porcellus]|uniref:uncharacterized protein LOC106027021 isoform X5 n=1 Tax=Cavia porcellus TaxID=10141 RepID=UPI002FDF8810